MPPLGGGIDRRRLHLAQRALRERREGADLLDLVAEELDAQRLAAGRREDVDQAAADGELPPLLDTLDALVARRGEVLGERLDARLVAVRERSGAGRSAARRQTLGDGGRRRADEPAGREHLERTRALADEVRRRLEPGAPAHAARRQERHLVVADEPAGGLRGVARVGVVGEERDEAALDLLVDRRQHERKHGLRDAGARRQRSCEFLQPLLRAQALDECCGVRDGPWRLAERGVRPGCHGSPLDDSAGADEAAPSTSR